MRAKWTIPVLAVVAALTLSGCVDNSAPPTSSGDAATVGVDKAAEALLPDDIRSAGKLIVGVDPNYAPNEFKGDDGEPIGWAVELVDLVGAKLGLEVEYKPSGFDKIIPSIVGGTYNMGSSSFTDTVERQEKVDFVNYFNAGIQWAQLVGQDVDPDNACGLSVSVQRTTYEETDELPAKSQACVDAGNAPITIVAYETQDEATNALKLGKVSAMSADSPITLYAVSKVPEIEVAGEAFDVAPYGFAVAKDSSLTKAVQAAMQSLVDDGNYKKILDAWGVSAGGISTITINAGANG